MELLAERLPWYVAGPALGLLVVGLLWVANKPLGATGGWIDLIALARRPSTGIRWTVFFLAGIVIGGFLSSFAAGGLRIEAGYGLFDERFGTSFATRGALLALAGAVMGFGARTMGGCTSGHGICGTSLGSTASWICTAVFMGTAVAVANGLALLVGGRP